MRRITRRDFVKAAAAIGATAAIGRSTLGRYIMDRNTGSEQFSLTEQFELVETALAEEVGRGVTIVSDVDGHSQCLMSVDVEEGKVIDIRGDPLDPEGRGKLTLRGKHMKSVLYAPDRLQYPMKRVGEKGGGEWERISWDEALTTIADKFNEIKKEYGAEAIDLHYGHYHSGDISSYLSRLANLIGTPDISTPNLVCHVPRIFMQFIFDFGAVGRRTLLIQALSSSGAGIPMSQTSPSQ